MKSFSAANLAAIAARQVIQRDFLSITVRDMDTNAPVTFDFWSDIGSFTADVYDAESGVVESRTFHGAGNLIEVSPIASVSNLTVQDVTLTMSALTTAVNDAFRGYNARQGKVRMWRGWMNPVDRRMVDEAEPVFLGVIDSLEVRTSREGEDSVVVVTCRTDAIQLTRSNPDTRSDRSQRRRNSGDAFFASASTVGEWELFWGTKPGKIQTSIHSRINAALDNVK